MNTRKLVFAQVMAHLPLTTFRRCVARYDGEHKVKRFSCLDQYLCMAFAQLTFRNTRANANAVRDWRIHADFAQSLINIARKLYVNEPFGVDLANMVYALDATTIDLCLSVFPWAPFRSTKAAVRLLTLLDLRGNIPGFLYTSKDEQGKTLVFLANNLELNAVTISELYRCRWQVELFFKWTKQHLRIKAFFGTSENAVKSQIWIAVSVYVLVAILRKRLNLSASLYQILQVLSLTLFERTPLDQLLTRIPLERGPALHLIFDRCQGIGAFQPADADASRTRGAAATRAVWSNLVYGGDIWRRPCPDFRFQLRQ